MLKLVLRYPIVTSSILVAIFAAFIFGFYLGRSSTERQKVAAAQEEQDRRYVDVEPAPAIVMDSPPPAPLELQVEQAAAHASEKAPAAGPASTLTAGEGSMPSTTAEKATAEKAPATEPKLSVEVPTGLSSLTLAQSRRPPPPPAPAPALAVEQTAAEQAKRWALEHLPKGKIVLEAPKTMRVGEFRDVYANVGKEVDDKLLRTHTGPTDQSIDGVLAISGKMSAVLTGSGFKIKNTTPEEQDVTEGFVTVWNWEIEARQEGEQKLEATLYVTLPGIARQRIDSYRHKIGVIVKPPTWGEWFNAIDTVTKIATPIGTAITVVFGWFGWSFWRRKKYQFSRAFPPGLK